MEGKTARGASSPANPALHMPEPLSTTRAATSSSHILTDFCKGNKLASGLPDLSWHNIPKRVKFTKLQQNYEMTIKIPNGRYIFQMGIKYTNIFHFKSLQNVPKLEFLA
jgi:hypothetical protein